MLNFEQYTPTRVIFGKGTETKTGKEIAALGGKRVFIVYGGGSVIRSGLMKSIEESLEAEGLIYEEFGGAKPNPTLSHALEGVVKGKEFGADFVLAVGGGSAIDTAKGIAMGIANPELDFWPLWTGEYPLKKILPVGVVLTIAAAGSEMSKSAVLTNEETGIKKGVQASDLVRPLFAVMDPELLASVPEYHIMSGIVDIMMHTLDRYFVMDGPARLSDEIAEGVLRTMIYEGPIALKDPKDYDAMAEVMWASSVSHNDMTGLGRGVRDFAVHGLGAPLSAHYDAIHGATLSALWGTWAEYVYKSVPGRFARYARTVWGVTGEDDLAVSREGIEKTVSFFRSIGAPVSITDLLERKLTDDEIHKLAMDVTAGGSKSISRVQPLAIEDVEEIYRRANA